jgi:hypothetical protein
MHLGICFVVFILGPSRSGNISIGWWLERGDNTRFHSELDRKDPQRRWYFVLRRGRVGRCQPLEVYCYLSIHF